VISVGDSRAAVDITHKRLCKPVPTLATASASSPACTPVGNQK
jgi:hypothetical protein